jgi:hypothetical protein
VVLAQASPRSRSSPDAERATPTSFRDLLSLELCSAADGLSVRMIMRADPFR